MIAKLTPLAPHSLGLLLVLATAIGLAAACSSRSGGSSTPPSPTGERWLGELPAYPGARQLCSQSINAGPSHVLWTAYATTDAFERVVGFYEQQRGGRTFEKADDGHFSLRGSDGKLVSIHPREGKYPTCDVPPAAGERTVLIVSQMMGSGSRP